jgi:hypothetical protein
MRDKYSVPLFAIWPTSIVGNAGPRLRVFYEALKPFSAISPCFDVPNVRRLLAGEGPAQRLSGGRGEG